MSRRLLSLAAALLLALPVAAVDAAASPGSPASSQPAAESSADNPLQLPDNGLFTPDVETQAPPCSSCASGFTSSPGGGAASHWGFGSDCTAATSDLRSQLSNYANNECAIEGDYGRCAFSVIHTSSCFWNSGYGQFQIDGYTNFSCWISWC